MNSWLPRSWRGEAEIVVRLLGAVVFVVCGLYLLAMVDNRYGYLTARAQRVISDSCVTQQAWLSNGANEPTCAELRDDYRNGHTEFGGYNRGYAEALEGFSLSHGEQICMERLTPDALKKHLEVRMLQQQAAVRMSVAPNLKFVSGSCVAFLGEESVEWEAAVVHGTLLSMFNRIPDQAFKQAFVVEKASPSHTRFWVRGLAEPEARSFCSYVRGGYGYYRCEVSCREGIDKGATR